MSIINYGSTADLPEGAVRVSARGEYHEGAYSVEELGYANTYRLHWGKPAWEERGMPELARDYATRGEAVAAMRKCGFK